MKLLSALINSSDSTADSVIVGGLAALVSLFVFVGYALVRDPTTFSPIGYGTAATAILTGIGGAKRLRDGLTTTTAISPSGAMHQHEGPEKPEHDGEEERHDDPKP